ncbi:response regulator [Paenibacillus ginsengarvi]|uniref:Response regulator n=1 Tax=Paenibacillus ginsengarvi TaxID=400777 RepID=A0A3B0CFX2_9BACL|nr:response regulator [Paenibacillus ginsengarvi]RKN84483.1 response regulator [Paenibacillus ginsengarvi]
MQLYLIDDDAAVRKMLERMIAESGLGEVVGEAADGLEVTAREVAKADVVLMDLLMPGRDGIETIKALRKEGYIGTFVMISQVEHKELVGEAYREGVDTFISKPINRNEVLSVLRRVEHHLNLVRSIDSIRHSLRALGGDAGAEEPVASTPPKPSLEEKAGSIMLQLGIAGEAGAGDLMSIVRWLDEEERKNGPHRELPSLKDLYAEVLRKEERSGPPKQAEKEVRALEQRMRRMVLQTLTHLSSLGLTDYANPIFEHYASRLFEFKEVRTRMRELEQETDGTNSKVNVKKFIQAFYLELKQS